MTGVVSDVSGFLVTLLAVIVRALAVTCPLAGEPARE